MNLEEALDQLYGVALGEFIEVRNTLAKELGPDGAALKALRKPNLAAWSLNQLARRHAAEVAELFEVTDAVRSAQRRVMSGAKAAELRTATDARNAVVSKLTKLAAGILEASGHAAATATVAAISDSLVAVASDEEGGDRLRAGRLERPLERTSVLDVGGLTLVEPVGESGEGSSSSAAVSSAGIADLRSAVSTARARLKEAKDAVREARAEADRLAREADEAERVAAAKREGAEFARRALEAREGEAAEAERELEGAEDAMKDG